jgi:hypothetical protein
MLCGQICCIVLDLHKEGHMNNGKIDKHIQESLKETKIIIIAIAIQNILIGQIKRFNWFEEFIGKYPWIEHPICAIVAANLLVVLETFLLTRMKRDLFFISKRISIFLALLVVMAGLMLIMQAHLSGMGSFGIALLFGIMAVNTAAVWLAPGIREDKILLKSIMVTLPVASLGIAIGIAGPSITNEILHPASIIIENDCRMPIEYLNVNLRPYSIQTISIPSLICTIDRDESGIIIKGTSLPGGLHP